MRVTQKDLIVMARTVWGEARGEPYEGQVAVAHVIVNRVKHPTRWPNYIADVCTQPFQFSCWNSGDPNRVKMQQQDYSTKQMRQAVRACLDGIDGEDTTESSDHYFADYIDPPSWAKDMTFVKQIGVHKFWRS